MELLQHTDNELWNMLNNDSIALERSFDKLKRKQTGSYYTSLDLTCFMMQELVDSLSLQEKATLYCKRFFEPCVGSGNFVFAYLKVCKSLQFSREQNITLLNNIYACDIMDEALGVYRKNLEIVARQWFGIDLDDDYFNSHLGKGLLFDVNASDISYIPISDVFGEEIEKKRFDIVVTNPPYKNLKAESSHYSTQEERNSDKLKYTAISKNATQYFVYSTTGTLNIYKLFVEEIIERYLTPTGTASLLIPSSFLSDKSCSKLRTHIIETSSIKSVRVIWENSNYVDASQSLCAVLLQKGKESTEIYIDNSFCGKSGQGITVSVEDIIDLDTGNAILALGDKEYVIRKQMKQHQTIREIPFIHNLRGELDITLNSTAILKNPTLYPLLRGRNIGYYETVTLKQQEYVDEAFVESTAKKDYIFSQRLVCQQIANMAKKRRIAFTLIPENTVLANSCNFISIDDNEAGIDIYFLMGVLNSTLIDWYFKLTSSNNHINNYEIDNFPIPLSYQNKKIISDLVKQFLLTKDESILSQIDDLVYEAYGVKKSDSPRLQTKEFSLSLSKEDIITNEFYDAMLKFMPGVSYEECRAILEHRINMTEVMFQYGSNLSAFENKILTNLEMKYRKLFDGEILNHTTFKLSDLDLEMIRSVPQGGSWKDIPEETVKKSRRLERITSTGGRTTLYGRIDYSMPSYTITTYFNRPGNGTYVHPIHQRVISVREAARFQSFPDDYFFCGNKTDMLKQVGNAVPVLLAYNIGKSIVEKTGCKTSVDLFSGAGGMTYGFKKAGISAVIANDFSESACVTLKTNSPEIPVYCGDITEQETKQAIINAGKLANADIICGGPPCQGFSLAGFRMKNDPRNELFRHFVEIVSAVNPKVIVFENVEGLLSYQNGETYRNIIELFSELGYRTEGRKLLANHYGVPQRRKRVIILCTRNDIEIMPSDIFPNPITPNDDRQITARETIYDLEDIQCGENAIYTSVYTSPYIKYLKGDISIDDYIALVKDPRGSIEPENATPLQKQKFLQAQEPAQLSLFDIM